MTLDFQPGDDFPSLIDGTETVTLTRPGSSLSLSVSGALRRAVTTAEAQSLRSTHSARSSPSAGRYTASDVAWHLPAGKLAESPRPGDVIVDAASQRWTVLAAIQNTLQGRWRCVSRNLLVVHGLDQYVDVERAVYAKGDDGAGEPTWRVWRTGLPARVQPIAAEVDNVDQRRATRTAFKIFLAEPVALDHTHRIKGPDGTIYRITGYQKPERIDALMEISALLVT